jgi:hypothetical protein
LSVDKPRQSLKKGECPFGKSETSVQDKKL